jgi:hypothetical protein|tara:strand:+ start:6800 stop:7348 length:549 start_codon:yes stop_codon:yes gene_type:complete
MEIITSETAPPLEKPTQDKPKPVPSVGNKIQKSGSSRPTKTGEGRGRKSKLTPQLAENLGLLIREGCFVVNACDIVGINQDTFYDWKKRGRADLEEGENTIYSEFVELVTREESKLEAELIQLWKGYMVGPDGDYRAIRDFMRYRWPKRYSPTVKTELSGTDGEPIEITFDVDVAAGRKRSG